MTNTKPENNRLTGLKLCYSIPELEADTQTHHFHLFELLEEIGKQIRVFVVVDRPAVNPYPLKNIEQVYFTKFAFFPLRKLEQFLVFCSARLRGYQYFYIHYSLWNALFVSFLTKLFGGKTFLWCCHCNQRIRLAQVDSWRSFRQWLTDLAQVIAFKAVDRIVTGTASVAREYVKEFAAARGKFILIPNWVNLARFNLSQYEAPKRNKRNKTVAFIHSITEAKGAMYLPDIIIKVLNKVNGVNFLIIGDGNYRQAIQAKINELGLQEQVQFFGYIPNQDIPKYLSYTDLLISPSVTEGFPRILLEAMAMGVPFVSTDAGGVRDLVSQAQKEYVTPTGDMDRFSAKVVELLTDEAKRSFLRQEGLRQVQSFTLTKVAGMFLEKIK